MLSIIREWIARIRARWLLKRALHHSPASPTWAQMESVLFEHLRQFENSPLASKPQDYIALAHIDEISTARVTEIGYGFTPNGIWDAKRYGKLPLAYKLPSRMTRLECDAFLSNVIIPTYGAMVDKHVTVSISPRQRAALISFAFNLGESALKTLVSRERGRLNAGDYNSPRDVMPLYRMSGGKRRLGLVRRRAAEVKMFYGA